MLYEFVAAKMQRYKHDARKYIALILAIWVTVGNESRHTRLLNNFFVRWYNAFSQIVSNVSIEYFGFAAIHAVYCKMVI